MKPKLFGSSGVRSVVNVGFTPVLVSKIGLAIASSCKAKRVLMGRDTRVSGLMIEDALVAGLLSGGADVECLGIVPTPVLAYLTGKLKVDAGVMITASHNPPQYNGLKIFDKSGLAYDGQSQDEIERIVEDQNLESPNWRNIGQASSTDRGFLYLESIAREITLNKNWNLVVDPGCGATYQTAPDLLRNLGCKVMAINAQPDGFFPGRSPEPNRQSLNPLARIVKDSNADLGVAFDGDGDRVAFIDEEGVFVDFDQILAAYAAFAIKKNCGGTIVTNVEASMCVEKMVKTQGGKVIRTKVGDVHVAQALKRHHAVFGGEPCGAWIHPQFHYCPDGVYSSIVLLKALEDEGVSLSDFVSETPKFQTLRENVPCQNESKHKVIEGIKEALINCFPSYRHASTVDGLRLTLQDGWILARASGTEPLIRLTVEGESLKRAEEIMETAIDIVKKRAIEETSK